MRILLAVCVVFLRSFFLGQNAVFMMTSIIMIIAIGHTRSRQVHFDTRMDYFNELKLTFIQYHIICFTNFVPEPETRFLIGYSCCAILIIGVGSNMIMLVVQPIQVLKRKCKIRH